MNKYAVVIPSYTCRNQSKAVILNHLDKFDSKFDVYLFLSESDKHLSDYDNLPTSDNVYKVITPCKTICEKREYALNYVTDKRYKGYFQFDDDVEFVCYKIDESTKRTTSDTYKFYKCELNEAMDKMIRTAEEYDAGYITVVRWGYLGWQKPNKVKFNHQINSAQIGYFDIDKLKNANIHYDTSNTIFEDTDLIVQMCQNDINVCTVCDYMYKTSNVMYKDQLEQSTMAGEDYVKRLNKFAIGLYLKYHSPLVVKDDILLSKLKYKYYRGTKELPDISDEYNQKLYELCLEGNVEEIKKYIIENGNGKK